VWEPVTETGQVRVRVSELVRVPEQEQVPVRVLAQVQVLV